jgi:hypothetical protein
MSVAFLSPLEVAREKGGRALFFGETARTPARFHDRVLAQFSSPENRVYLRVLTAQRIPPGPLQRYATSHLDGAMTEFARPYGGRAIDILESDPVSRRGGMRPALDLWAEVRRLNLAFITEREALLLAKAPLISPSVPRDGISDDDEPYHFRMFVADSLRPPGLEHLNTPGPLYALREDQAIGTPRHGGGNEDEGEDEAWGLGDPNRTPEQAIAEYWGENKTSSESAIGAPERAERAYGSQYAWGDSWRENGGTRWMRYERIPFWQKGGREGCELDPEETLGTQMREAGNPVRRWDLDRVTAPRGQEYRRYGER